MDQIEQLVCDTIPIYTVKNPNPETGKEDCRLQRIHKEGRRTLMRMRISEVVARFKKDSEKEDEVVHTHKKEY